MKKTIVFMLFSIFSQSYSMQNGLIHEEMSEIKYGETQKMNYGEAPTKLVSHLLTVTERLDYLSTWNSKLTLQQNQDMVLRIFLKTCVDFSFKVRPGHISDIVYGETESCKDIAFFNKDAILDKIDVAYKTPVAVVDASQFCDFNDELKEQIMVYFRTLVQDPIGCKLLRIMITKYRVNRMPKIAFVPDKQSNSRFCFCKSQYMGNILGLDKAGVMSDRSIACFEKDQQTNSLRISSMPLPERNNFVVFPKNESDRSVNALMLSFVKDGVFSLGVKDIPVDAILLHEMLHSIFDPSRKLTKNENVIENRYDVKDYKEVTDAWKKLLSDDDEYITMFGVGVGAINLLNESAYMARKYSCMRVAHSDPIGYDPNGERLKSFCGFIERCGDKALYNYYLSPNSSVKYPCFGVGQYEYSKSWQ